MNQYDQGASVRYDPMKSKEVPPKIIREYCPQVEGGMLVRVLKDPEGNIGGFIVNAPIRDSPISYLDANGEFLTSFHIFGPPKEKEAASKIIERLMKRFSHIEPLVCPSAPDTISD